MESFWLSIIIQRACGNSRKKSVFFLRIYLRCETFNYISNNLFAFLGQLVIVIFNIAFTPRCWKKCLCLLKELWLEYWQQFRLWIKPKKGATISWSLKIIQKKRSVVYLFLAGQRFPDENSEVVRKWIFIWRCSEEGCNLQVTPFIRKDLPGKFKINDIILLIIWELFN